MQDQRALSRPRVRVARVSEWLGYGLALSVGVGLGVYLETLARQWYNRTNGGTKG